MLDLPAISVNASMQQIADFDLMTERSSRGIPKTPPAQSMVGAPAQIP
jgi:hypothetical protein